MPKFTKDEQIIFTEYYLLNKQKPVGVVSEELGISYSGLRSSLIAILGLEAYEATKTPTKGRKCKPRTKEHSAKIIQSKRANGTLKHTEEAKAKMSKAIKAYYDTDASLKHRGHSTNSYTRGEMGYCKNIHYRSSYEKRFIQICDWHIIACTNRRDFAIEYMCSQGRRRLYFPDFYLPEIAWLIEIKPANLLNYGLNPLKFEAARAIFNDRFIILTEYDLWP